MQDRMTGRSRGFAFIEMNSKRTRKKPFPCSIPRTSKAVLSLSMRPSRKSVRGGGGGVVCGRLSWWWRGAAGERGAIGVARRCGRTRGAIVITSLLVAEIGGPLDGRIYSDELPGFKIPFGSRHSLFSGASSARRAKRQGHHGFLPGQCRARRNHPVPSQHLPENWSSAFGCAF